DPKLERLCSEIGAAGLILELLDLTSDLEIPVIAAVARPWPSPGRVAIGFGAHFDVRRALCKAVTEMAQTLALKRWIDDAQFLRAITTEPVSSTPLPKSNAMQLCIATARKHDLEVLVADLTRRDIGVPVVKVLVPGLRPAMPRYAPGRLYDVPR